MECLATFVVLFLLPLASAALVLAWRARRAARNAAEEIALLRQAVTALSARIGSGAVAARAATENAQPAVAREATAADVTPRPELAIDRATAAPIEAAAPQPSSTPPLLGELSETAAAATAEAAPIDPALTGTAAARETATSGAAREATTPTAALPPPTPTSPPPPTPPARSLEERLGARLPVWIGAIALVLAAAFLVKYSVDQGWIGPTVRVTLGALFGIVLLAGGELLRRSTAPVAQGLTAAGIAVLFVVELAAVHLYHLIGPAAGFALLALTTATAVTLALRHGPIVALLGLVGGFLTPVLVSTGQPNARLLFAYLALLQAGLLAVSRRRGWAPLGGLTLLAALVWAGGWTVSPFGRPDAWVIGVFLVVSVAATLVASAGTGERWGAPLAGWARAIAAGGALVVSAVLAVRTDFGLVEWGFLGLLAAGCLVLARLSPQLQGLAWLGAAAVCQVLGIWADKLQPAEAPRFFAVAAGALLLVAGGAWALRWRAAKPARWAALAAAASLAVDLIAWYGADRASLDLPWGWIEVALAVVWIVLALPVARRRAALEGEAVLAAAAVAATTLVSLAVPMELERQWITVAWALEVAALVWLAGRLRVPLLAHLAALLTALVGARLLLNPAVLDYPTGTHPILSWLLYGYGVPIAALALATVLARRQERHALALGTGAVAVALAVVFLGLAVHQAFHPGLKQVEPSLAEWGVLTISWLALGCALLAGASAATATPLAEPAGPAETAVNEGEATADVPRVADMHPWPELRFGGPLVVFLAVGQALLAQCALANPLFFHQPVGDRPVLNLLLPVFALPLVLLMVAARLERRLEARWAPWLWWAPRLWSIVALLLLFVVVSLEVRQAFHGNYLDAGPTTSAEQYAYSAAWILLATGLLVAGVARGRRTLRLASLPVMLLAVGKVFLYDTANLSDLYRVFSFLGLGISLLLLAWVYQRFVFRRGPEAA
ncbi:MAG TPA: DUF2339 domain-containing protein [Thermoanaerobaculia bacterium]|jgi:uncharacterized membrane protein|nr:DUF2339 domain-containing protein [Thermoanaerobaculia bacterium]